MKKYLAVCAALSGLGCAQLGAETLKIAMIEALSGPAASTGVAFTEGMRYGVAKINQAGGFNGAPIQLLEYDNQGGPNGAADKFKTAVAEGVRIVSSASSSACGRAASSRSGTSSTSLTTKARPSPGPS